MSTSTRPAASPPLIGITLDYAETGSFSKRPHYALRTHYFDAITHAGGLPVAIPFAPAHIHAYLERVDGLLMPGGTYAFPAPWYIKDAGKNNHPASPRFAFDEAMMQASLATQKPVLGICAGMQIMAGVQGARFYADAMAAHPTTTNHLNAVPAEHYAHPVKITPGSLLHRLVKQESVQVNSAHREAVAKLPDTSNLHATATAPDGIIEAVEVPNHPFALGVQWHPEFFTTEATPDMAILKGFVDACRPR